MSRGLSPDPSDGPNQVSGSRLPICDYEGSDYQDRFWAPGDRLYEDAVEAAALRRLLPSAGRFMLEIGAGAGRNTPRYRGFERIALVDYSRSQLQQAQHSLGKDDRYLYVAADVYRLPFVPGLFDGATMIRTLHHMADPAAALASVAEVLEQRSTFVLEYANKRNLKAVLRWLVRAQAWNPFDRATVEFVRLNFNFHPQSVRAWLEEAGFVVERELAVSMFRQALLKRIFPAQALIALDVALQPSGKWILLSPSVFLRARASLAPNFHRQGAFWRCPVCRSHRIGQNQDGLRCQNCGRDWPLQDGIYDLRTRLEE
jgi:ubiquinone/menaquinone biosynthesis C-methylase UbiE